MTSTDLTNRTPAQVLVTGLRSDTFKQQIAVALPGGVTPERFVRIAVTAIQQNPDLAAANHDSVIQALLRSAADGLLPDGREAALVIFNKKVGDNQWEKQAQYMPMIGGFRKIAAEYNWTLRTRVVYEGDEFEYGLDTATLDEKLVHRPARPGEDRGALVAAYAIAAHKDGRREVEVMYREDIEKARGVSRAKDRGPWVDWEERMWEKTVGRRLFAKLPLGELDERVERILAAASTDPSEATRLIYGASRTEPSAALPPAGTDTSISTEMATRPLPQADGAGVDQQADGATQEKTSPPPDAAPSAPGFDDEPSLENDDEQTAIQAAADQAAMFHPPTGQYRNLSLGEILAVPEKGAGWIRWALRKGDQLNPIEYRTAVWSFARVYATEIYTQVLAEHEAQAAA